MLHWVLIFGLASSLASPTADIDDTGEEHCVMYVLGQHEDGEFILSDPVCYKTIREVEVLLAENARSSVLAGGFGETLGSFTIGRHFDGFNGTGSSVSIVGVSCTGGYWNTSAAWDNRISSSYNGCARLRHYDLPNKAGTFQDTYGLGSTDNLSLLNNKVESISYHSS